MCALQADDLIEIPYTPDLTQAGLAYACRSLPHTFNRMGGSTADRLRRIVAGVAVELALRRYLAAQEVPFDTLGATPFTDPDHYDLALGGRRCDIKSFQFFEKDQIRRVRRDPQRLLQAAALAPADQVASEHWSDHDLYLFAFVTALVTRTRAELQRAVEAGQPVYYFQAFPADWTQPRAWRSLGSLQAESEAFTSLSLEAGGQTAGRAFEVEALLLPPRAGARLLTDFYSLAYLHADQVPSGRVSVSSRARAKAALFAPRDWENIWVYGMEIYLAGYITRGEFRQRAARLPAGSRVLQYARTRVDNYHLPVHALHPLGDLFQRVKAWGG
jgi:hypothetical protein